MHAAIVPTSMLHADWALLPDGFAANVTVAVHDGVIADVITGSPRARDAEHLSGVLLPGIANLHSHAFQRVFAGLTAHTGGGGDFWSWRTAMYQAAARMTPELYAPVTAYLGKELLKGGYTAFAEFHYLHHQPNGKPYADRTAMAEAIYAGAAQAGIGLTLLVALYETGGFGGAPLAPAQQRFRGSSDTALAMVQDLAARHTGTIGLALHSLRAVPPETLRNAVTTLSASNPAAPIHIHIAEQTAEVEACIAALGAPPIAWLLENAPVDHRWCLVHATHATAAELTAAAQTGAVAGLCPSTEADLGDGLFNLPAWLQAEGAYGVGSDSNTRVNAAGELRLLEWGQRLGLRRRNVTATPSAPCGRAMWQAAAIGGARACGIGAGRIAAGARADFVVMDATPEAGHAGPDFVLDAAIFAASAPVRHVMANGHWVVRDRRHRDEADIDAAYGAALKTLAA